MRSRAWDHRQPRKLFKGQSSGGRLSMSKYTKIMEDAYLLYKAKGRAAAISHLKYWRDWLLDFQGQGSAELPASGELLDRLIAQKEALK